MIASVVEGASTVNNVFNLTAAQDTIDPNPISALNYATSVKGEILRLRYMIKAITGESEWSDPPATSISDLVSQSAEALSLSDYYSFNSYGEASKEGLWSHPNAMVSGKYCGGQITSLQQKFGSSSLGYGTMSFGTSAIKMKYLGRQKFSVSGWVKAPKTNGPILVIPIFGGELSVDNTGALKFSLISLVASASNKKTTVSITGAALVNDGNWHHFVISIDGSLSSGSRKIGLIVDGVQDGTPITNGTFVLPDVVGGSIVIGNEMLGYASGDFDPAANIPSAQVASMLTIAPSGFSVSGTITQPVVAQYVNFANASSSMSVTTPQVILDSGTVHTYVRLLLRANAVSNTTATAAENSGFVVSLRDDSANRSFRLVINQSGISLVDFGDAGGSFLPLDTSKWHEYVLIASNGAVDVHVDGEYVGSFGFNASDSTASDLCSIGFTSTSSGSVDVAQFENFTSASYLFTSNNQQSYMDDVCVLDDYLTPSSVFVIRAQSQSAFIILNNRTYNFEPQLRFDSYLAGLSFSSESTMLIDSIPCDGSSEYEIQVSGTVESPTATSEFYVGISGGRLSATYKVGTTVQSYWASGSSRAIGGVINQNGAVVPFFISRRIRSLDVASGSFLLGVFAGANSTSNFKVGTLRVSVVPIRFGC